MRTTLDNGLKVILVEDHSAPVVALNVWVRTGSADEQPSEAGMAHVFEHMLFKGTERRGVGEIASTVEAAGGDINAYTSFDQTVYHITMASRDVGTGIDVLADAVQHSTFDPEEVARENEVVVDEIRRGKDSPETVLSEAMFAAAYTKHPYRLPVIGTSESVLSFTRPQLLDFLHRWYVPNNMTFIAVGDFESPTVLAQIQAAFKGAKPSPGLAHPRASEPAQTRARGVLVRERFEQSMLGIGYPITRFADTDTAYLDLLAGVLGGGDSSRLYREVKDRRQLVYSVNASAYTPLDPGLFFIDAELEPERLEEALRSIGQEIARLAAFGPSAAELERARVNQLSTVVRDRETMEGQARKLGYWETIGGGIEREAEYLTRLREATPEDIRRVAATYLKPEHATVTALIPKEARPGLGGDQLAVALAASNGKTASLPEPITLGNDLSRFELPNGLRVIVKRNPAVQLVAMRMSFLGGQLVENESSQGITSFFAEMLDRGTEGRSAAEFASEVEAIAGSLSGFSGRNSFGISAEFLSDSLDTGIELFADMLLHPRFDPAEIDVVRSETMNALKRRDDALSQQAFELFSETLHSGHPYRFRTLGTPKTIAKIDQKTLQAYYDAYVHPRNAVLAIVGDVDPERVLRSLEVYLADWQKPGTVVLPPRGPSAQGSKQREASITKGKEQVHVVIGFPGIAISDPDVPALDVLTQLLSGQAGRLFLELRDKKSLAYTVSAFTIEGLDHGSWGVYIASAPDKLKQSLDGLNAELQKVLDEPFSDEELERARNYLIGSQAVSFQRLSLQASAFSLDELYGLGARNSLEYPARIAAVTRADVERVAHRIIQLETPIVAIVK